VYSCGSYRKINTGLSLFGPLCRPIISVPARGILLYLFAEMKCYLLAKLLLVLPFSRE